MNKYKKSFKTKKKVSSWKIFKNIIGNKFFWFGVLFIGIISGVSYFLFFSGVFEIKTIEVTGTEKLSEKEITEIVNQNTNKNIILANIKETREEILAIYVEIAEIKIKRKFPNTILIQIEERKPILALRENEIEYYLIDKEGFIFEKTLNIPDNIPEIKKENQQARLGETIIEKEVIEKILKIKSEMGEKLKTPIKEIVLFSSKKVEVKTDQQWKVYLNFEKNLDWQIEQLKIILEEKISEKSREKLEYIDLRFNKIYIFPEIKESN